MIRFSRLVGQSVFDLSYPVIPPIPMEIESICLDSNWDYLAAAEALKEAEHRAKAAHARTRPGFSSMRDTIMEGVVQPGEDIVDIVPDDGTLLVEAKIRSADIAFFRPGQPAVVKLTAYDFSIYGGLDGVLEHISADTI